MAKTADQRRSKQPPPADDDPRFRRTCNQCNHIRNWVVAVCPKCGWVEFSIPKDTSTELNGSR